MIRPEKKVVLLTGPRCGVEIWKVLYRDSRDEAYRHEKILGREKDAKSFADALRSIFDDIIYSRL